MPARKRTAHKTGSASDAAPHKAASHHKAATPVVATKDDATGDPLAIPPADHPEDATQIRTNSDGARTGSV